MTYKTWKETTGGIHQGNRRVKVTTGHCWFLLFTSSRHLALGSEGVYPKGPLAHSQSPAHPLTRSSAQLTCSRTPTHPLTHSPAHPAHPLTLTPATPHFASGLVRKCHQTVGPRPNGCQTKKKRLKSDFRNSGTKTA